jgi:hypothetical protein
MKVARGFGDTTLVSRAMRPEGEIKKEKGGAAGDSLLTSCFL